MVCARIGIGVAGDVHQPQGESRAAGRFGGQQQRRHRARPVSGLATAPVLLLLTSLWVWPCRPHRRSYFPRNWWNMDALLMALVMGFH